MRFFYPIRRRVIAHAATDAVIAAASYLAGCVLVTPPACVLSYSTIMDLAVISGVYITCMYALQVYRVMWAYSNLSDHYRLIAAHAVAAVCLSALHVIGKGGVNPMLIMWLLVSLTLSILFRIVIRDISLRRAPDREEKGDRKRILIVGAGEAGRIILSEYEKKGLGHLVAGFLDDDPNKVGTMLNGKPVLAPAERAPDVIEERGIAEIIIAMPSAGPRVISRIASRIRRHDRSLPIRILPSILELDERRPLSVSLRDIGLAELLGREEVRVDYAAVEKKYAGKTVMVTGAGGSIGSELCRQLMKFDIGALVAVGRGEFSMYNLIRELEGTASFLERKPEIAYRIGDVRDFTLMESVFARYRPEIVFHAAAHKHVPLMEFNEAEAVQNNVGGTRALLDLSCRYRVGEFVFISTDKAVNPSSVMGATKRLAEIVTLHYHRTKGLPAAIVRFGNVIGSRGSVIPLFMEQIARGGPVTVTHPEVTRYFMSIPEASLLVLHAAAFSSGGEIMALDMGEQYRVADVARRLIEFYGYRPDDEIQIRFTGLRPGEKLHEELFYQSERLRPTPNEKIVIVTDEGGPEPEQIQTFIDEDLPRIAMCSPLEIRNIIKRLVREYDFDPEQVNALHRGRMVF